MLFDNKCTKLNSLSMGPQVTAAFLILHSPSENPEALSVVIYVDLDFDLDKMIIEILVSCPKYIFGQCNNRPIAYIFKYKYRCDNNVTIKIYSSSLHDKT